MNSYFNRDSIGDPTANGIITAGQMPGVMGVQAFDSDSRASDTTRGARSDMIMGNVRITFRLVQTMSIFKFYWINIGFGLVDSTRRFKSTDCDQGLGRAQPIQRRPRCSVGKKWSILDDTW
jgi:hypothetical protein